MPPKVKADSAKTPSLKRLKAQLKDTQSTLGDIEKFIKEFKDTATASDVSVRLEVINDIYETFCETLIDITSHDDFFDAEDFYESDRMAFNLSYMEAKSFLLERLREREDHTSDQSNVTLGCENLNHVQLPQIQLRTFTGDDDDWVSFRDLFTSLIHWRNDLSGVEKLQYLRGCLFGKPATMVDKYKMSNADYQLAWEDLLNYYNNSKQMRKRQIQHLFELPAMSKESSGELRDLIQGFEKVVQSLDQIVQPGDYKDLLLVHMLTDRLDPVSRRGWEEHSSTKEQDTVKDMLEFLQRRSRVLESLPPKSTNAKSTSQQPHQQPKSKPSVIRTNYSTAQASGERCPACTGTHLLHRCSVFQRMTVSDRESLLRTHSLCRNCLKPGHLARGCQSKYSCQNCKARHHTLLCFRPRKDQVKVASTTRRENAPREEPQAVVVVEDDNGNRLPARALLDSGSESNFMSERLSQRLRVKRNKVDISVSGIGQAVSRVKQQIQATVTVNLPTSAINTTGWTIPDGVVLADPTFSMSNGVDMVLGIEHFFDFFASGQKISLGEQLPALNESVFGWVVCGGCADSRESPRINCNVSALEKLDALVARFWSCEEVESAASNYSPEEARCEALYAQSVQRGTDGRYSVALPKAEDALSRLGESKDIAVRRLHGTERRLARDDHLREQYGAFMHEYEQLGHMTKVTDTGSAKRCYLPHHPVVREASTTTKVRVVFDASCKTSSGVSLNEVLLCGPVTQQDLRSIIYRCRVKQIMLVADVEKMFRQIGICPEDRLLQCVIWRPTPTEAISTYELNTVTYGTKPAPFLATRTLKQLAMDEKERFPLAAKVACEDIYMDDVITGTNNLDSAIDLRNQLDKMTVSCGFRLRKWACNRAEVLYGVEEDNLAIPCADGINLDRDPSVKTLGLTWFPSTDEFLLKFTIPETGPDEPLTKRTVLSKIASIFDPHGWFGATVTTAKVFMQQLWTPGIDGKRLEWDQPLPSMMGENWRKFEEQLPVLSSVRFARCVVIPNATSVQLHCFSDASTKAYGGCVYVRSENAKGEVMVHLLASKSRVAPLKVQTIPRLELCGAVLVAQLFKVLREALDIPVDAYFWTDSTCVLCWLGSIPTTWNVFVANRDIVDNEFWWFGPDWLRLSPDHWPNAESTAEDENAETERRRSVTANTGSVVQEFNDLYFSKFSSYPKLIRQTAVWLRLMKLLRTPSSDRTSGFLTTAELKEAENVLIRRVQMESFAEEIKALSARKTVAVKSPLRWYNPYLDQDNIIRVGGRLQHSDEPEDAKHPAVLPARHRFTRLILHYYHLGLLHAGPQLLLGTVRLRFWPLGGRSVARTIVHQCKTCFKAKPTPVRQFMGDLPAVRVTVARPFSKTGVDYFGPVFVRPGPRRTAIKAYVCLFVCLCTKAVHLELVSDLSTERFLQALHRFTSRRGPVAEIWSDNGTNFVGARNRLHELFTLLRDKQHQEKVFKDCVNNEIHWSFSPPSGPHFGGLWEAAVRSAKHHILRVIGDEPISIEDMNTLLVQVEGCLNSRPITPMSDDPNDLEPLTPAHFLVGTSLKALPDRDFTNLPANRLNHYQQIQQKQQLFWNRWKREYLSQLQARTKRWRSPVQIEVGKLVVIVDDNLPPTCWKLARISEVHPGADGVVRVVTLKTATKLIKRPVEKICLLPLDEEEHNAKKSKMLRFLDGSSNVLDSSWRLWEKARGQRSSPNIARIVPLYRD
ncbi:uncharacterized protein LOC119769297 [Culex quinquefasciatus]|uniref:uncharacterized protein LOC119769297 n=1 Tax=Culex quinquefasciatus TaxID=7176 RepID=UPI0018E39C5B|nr:uncharacterized protein LOC119769297 [Culex quinquefasciatus]